MSTDQCSWMEKIKMRNKKDWVEDKQQEYIEAV